MEQNSVALIVESNSDKNEVLAILNLLISTLVKVKHYRSFILSYISNEKVIEINQKDEIYFLVLIYKWLDILKEKR